MAFALTERERELMFRVAMKFMKDEQRAADVTQDAMLLAYRHQDDFRGECQLNTWLYRITATTALMHLRRERAAPGLVDALAVSAAPATPSPEEQVSAVEAVDLAGARLAALGEKYGRIFTMRFCEGYSETEIAERLHLNVATVKTRAHRARRHLARQLRRAVA
jgi:RNA polymerase sigma-70 factor (ECF subfamily)